MTHTGPSTPGARFGDAPSQPPPLADDEVRVLLVDLARPPEPSLDLLSREERERAARFHFDRHRRRYIVAHDALRRILGAASGTHPADLEFAEGEHGKPWLPGHPGLQFNLSHSAERALIACSRLAPLGVDIEERRPIGDREAVARRSFSPAECDVLASLPPDERLPAFYRCWTRKEAFIKATGEGLSRPLDSFDVTLAPGEPARLLRVGTQHGEVLGWSLFDLRPPGDYAGALALPAPGARLSTWTWSPPGSR